jgi:hypothetical protein
MQLFVTLVSCTRALFGRAVAQAVSRRSLTAEARVRSQVSSCGICSGQSDTRTGFSPSISVFPCQFHSTGAPLKGKMKKKLIVFITGLHNKPQGCGASVASAAGFFTTKKTLFLRYDRVKYDCNDNCQRCYCAVTAVGVRTFCVVW